MKKITLNFEKHNVPVEKLDSYEKRVMKADSLLQIIEVIYLMFKDLMSTIPKSKVPSQDNHEESDSKSEVGEENYENLEKMLQKYEAEIRNHIRIEQQMKIYTDSLQEKIEEKEKKHKENIETRSSKLKDMENKMMKMQQKLEEATSENKRLREVISFAAQKRTAKNSSMINHKYSSSIDSLKDTKKSKRDMVKTHKDDRIRSISRHKSRDVSPYDKNALKTQKNHEKRLNEILKGSRKQKGNLLVNFKKLYNQARKSKDYNIKNYANFVRLKSANSIVADKERLEKPEKSDKNKTHKRSTASRTHRGRELGSSKKVRGPFHSRKTSEIGASKK